MKWHDLGELYTYLDQFKKIYTGCTEEAAAIQKYILEIYARGHGQEDAEMALRSMRNPRQAGRKKAHGEKAQVEVKSLSAQGKSVREISKEMGIARSTVQRMIVG